MRLAVVASETPFGMRKGIELRRVWWSGGALLGLLLVAMSGAEAQNAGLLPNAQQYFTDANGAALASGFVYTYIPGTTTPLTTYQDSLLTVPNTNPIRLDSSGQARIWASTGTKIREQVLDLNSNLIWDQVSAVWGNYFCGVGTTTVGVIPSFGNTAASCLTTTDMSFAGGTLSWVETRLNPGSPGLTNVPANLNLTVYVQGNNADVHGGMGIYSLAQDAPGTTAGNKGVGYGGDFNVYPIVDHGNASPRADMVGVVSSNVGLERGTSGVFIGGTAHSTAASGFDFIAGLELAAWATYGIIFEGHFTYGIDFSQAFTTGAATYQAPIRLENNGYIVARDVGNSVDKNVIALGTDNNVYVGDIRVSSTGSGTGVDFYGTNNANGVFMKLSGTWSTYGLDLQPATLGSGSIRFPNNKGLFARNAANTADIGLISLDGTNTVLVGDSGAAALKMNGFGVTPGGKQPVCIDTGTRNIYYANAGAC